MKILLATVLLLTGLLTAARAQQEADDRYLRIYELIQQADSLAAGQQPEEALSNFAAAQQQLQQLKKTFPDWNPAIVNFRLNYLDGKITGLKEQGVAIAPPVKKTEPASAPSDAPSDDSAAPQAAALNAQLQSLRAENETLQAKLKEALAPQPAAVDPREIARAQEQIRNLMKENDLLKASHKTPPPAPPETIIVTDTNQLNQARLELAEFTRKFAAEHERAEKLAAENVRLDLKAAAGLNELAALRSQNAKLQEQLNALRTAATNAPDAAKLTTELTEARSQITLLKTAAEVIALEKKALENQLNATTRESKENAAAAEARIRSLTQEQDELKDKLVRAGQKKPDPRSEADIAQIAALNAEVKTLRSRIAVNEASVIPYTPEELAILRQATLQPSRLAPVSKPVTELPSGSSELVASAKEHFAKREFDQAEADYQKILERDQNNGLALANLATIELQEGKLDEAEKHIQAALVQSPDDAYNLSTLGYLKFRQEKYDDALNVLSRAAKIEPENPEIQNYLGVTLSHKGLRTQGETALRRALQIAPNYAPAHNNLAVIYLSAEAASPQLARWHYQKAIDAGQPRNAALEKMLADKGVPAAIAETKQ